MRTLLVIPAFNEAENIEEVVDAIASGYPAYDYVVVNDASADGTADVCRRRGYRLINLPMHLGLADAFQAGMKYALARGYDCAIQFDADGQHLPEYLDSLVAGLDEHDIVIGSRYLNAKRPDSLRALGNRMLAGAMRCTTGARLTDPTSGMRAYGRKAIRELATGPNLGPEPDTLAYLMRKRKLSVCEVPVRMKERTRGKSYFTVWKSSAYMLRMMTSVLFIQFFRS